MHTKLVVTDCSDLHSDLLEQVASKLNEFEDFTAFRGVCTLWRGSATNDKFVSKHKLPLLMFPGKEGGDNNVCEIYSLCKRKIISRIPVPEAKGKRCIGVGFGWILTEAFSGGELSLVNPMSSTKIQLPNIMNFPGYEDYHNLMTSPKYERSRRMMTSSRYEFLIQKAVLSANPSETSDFVLMVIGCLSLGLWRNKCNNWTKIETGLPQELANICFYKHKMYGVDFSGNVWMCDPFFPQTSEIILSLDHRWCTELTFWVESSTGDQLFLILRDEDNSILPKFCRSSSYFRDVEQAGKYFRVIRIDTVKREYGVINNLDGDAIFIGLNSAVSVAADDFPGVVKANCIYLPDDGSLCSALSTPGKCSYMRIHSVEDGSLGFEWLGLGVESFSLERPPQWLL